MHHNTCLFDLDGTLTDPFPGISRCIAHALTLMGMPVPEDAELRQWIGPPLKQSFESYLDSEGEGDSDQALRLYRERYADLGLYENSVYEGIPELLEKLRNQSIHLILATAKPSVYAHRIIDHFGLSRWLDVVYGSELDGRRSNKVDLLRLLLEQQQLDADECQMVGDREQDMLAAQYHGVGAIGVLWGYGTPVELLESGAETLVASPAELAEILIGNMGGGLTGRDYFDTFVSCSASIIAPMNIDLGPKIEQLRRTKIIATLGPATDDPEVLEGVIRAGADVFRLNMSHGTGDDQVKRAQMVREISASLGREVALLADLQGPKIRVERFKKGSADLVPDQEFILDAEDAETPGNRERVGVSYGGLASDVKIGDVLLLDDGLISMRVTSVQGGRIICTVENGGTLRDRKGLNLKGGGLSISGIAEHDLPHIKLAAEINVDYLAVSFVSEAGDMHRARTLLREAGSNAALVAKIERIEALDNLAEICDATDAIMVARGDLGVEIGDEELPGIQKRIISTAIRHNRIVVTATQMMQSMIEHPVPTRAEVLDVANAVIDGTDAVMLSAETAVGKYPVKVIEAINRICLGAERHFDREGDINQLNVRFERIDQAIAMAAMFMAANVPIRAIIALTESGSTAQWLSRVQSSVPIYALSPIASTRRRMAMYRNVIAALHEPAGDDVENVVEEALQILCRIGAVTTGDQVILTMGSRMGNQGGTNTLRLIRINRDEELDQRTKPDFSQIGM